MQPDPFQPQPPQPALVRMRKLTRQDRERLSGPALRTFANIADQWGLSEKQRLAMLGEPGRSTYYSWLHKAEHRASLTLPLDTLLRISAILGVYKGLAILFIDGAQALQWLRSPHKGTVFNGTAPLELMIEGAQDGIMTVRRYLDAWRGGHMGHGAPEGSFEPVVEDDIVFI